ncbi:MAG: YggS family pyridoxal phosphate-dependent enzyme [Clostridium perfringens]|nr:YggS family pyridoxal phosphate-dependent enzyme [Clostridium perfringens]
MDIKKKVELINSQVPKGVQVIAVSKTKPIEDMEVAYSLGVRDFGENKVQEILSKYDNFHKDVRWHLIGHLQTNKVKYIVGKVHLIQSLDSINLLNKINKVYEEHGVIANVLIQINIGREPQKYGILEEELHELLLEIEKCSFVKAKGLMAIIPKGNTEENRIYFKKIYDIYNKLKKESYKNIVMEVLSMGMSNDYKIAIEEGSNMVRIGQGIFGERNYNN